MIKSLLLAVSVIAYSPGYYTSLANHLVRWLKGEEITTRVSTPAEISTTLANEKIAFLVGFDSPTAAEMRQLSAFRARGGKLVVFHSSSPALAKLMGVKVIGYKTAPYPGAWSCMNFVSARPAGFPERVTQTSTVLQSAVPVSGSGGRVLAVWTDRLGRNTGEAAWIATMGGYWMTHVLLADGDEAQKARLCAAMCGAIKPDLWSAAASNRRHALVQSQTRALAVKQVPRRGEIHAVWDHSGCGLYPGNWPRTMRVLSDNKVTDIFVNVAGFGFAHYASNILPRSKTFRDEGDQLAACLKAAKPYGIRVHAWVLCFNSTRSSPETRAEFQRKGWLLKNTKGVYTDYIDPSKAEARARLLMVFGELQEKYPAITGVHLDFVRWYEGAVKPKNAADVISTFVATARRRVRKPYWLTAAVLGKYPACVASVGQDWPGWIDSGTVDYVVPMDYTSDNARFNSYLAQHAASRKQAKRIIPGIGVTANESRLNAAQVIEQIRLSRKYPFAGNALFDLDMTLEKEILPYLKLGIW